MSVRFELDPNLIHLNHGSFGAVTVQVREAQDALRLRMDRDGMGFFTGEWLERLDAARVALGRFLRARPEDLVFVKNATYAVSAVLRSLPLERGDEVLVTNHEYPACLNAVRATGAALRVAEIRLPVAGPDAVLEAVQAAITDRTRLALISHVTSPTGLVLPVERIVEELEHRGIPVLIDGAHAPGMLDLDLGTLADRGLRYYAANLHKWVCAPKGAAFLWASPAAQDGLDPPVTSHGAGDPWPGRTRFQTRFDWTGTDDPTPFLVVPDALAALAELHPGGHAGVRAANHELAVVARDVLLARLGTEPLAPTSMLGSLAAVKLPDDPGPPRPHALARSPLQQNLHEEGFRVPIVPFPAHPGRLIRISAHRYNSRPQYEHLADRLCHHLAAGR